MTAWLESSGGSTANVDTPREDRLVELLLQSAAGLRIVRLDHDDDPAPPLQIGSACAVVIGVIHVGRVPVVLGRDPQPSPADVEAVQLTAVDATDGQVRLGHGKPEIRDLPHQPALAG